MKRFTPLALSLSFAFFLSTPAQAAAPGEAPAIVDQGLAAGLDMMLLNSSLLRNGSSVWERAREGFELTEVNADIVRRQERFYAARPEYFKRTLDRSRKYLFHIMNEVEKRGMPTEIALLPMVESAFVPTAQSRVGAAGLWQFMPSTGRQYGLEQTWWYDGRRDVLAATSAALDYLQNLYGQFGDWNLALAAYNWGEGNVARAIARAQASGQTPSYENIRMPNETRNYVPKLLAVRNILAHPEEFGVRLDKFPNKPYFVAVNTGKHMDLDLAAKMAGLSVPEFKELNPAFNLPVYAHKTGRQMLVPAAKADHFQAKLASYDKPLLSWQVHVPKSAESVQEVASSYNMSQGQLLAANQITARTLKAGQPVLVALKAGTSDLTLDASDSAPAAIPTTLPAATTLLASAEASAAAVQETPAKAAPAMLLASAEKTVKAAPAERQADNAGRYTVASGDTLYSIARSFRLSVDELQALNQLDGSTVKLGQQLNVRSAPAITQLADAGGDSGFIKVSARAESAKPASTEYVVKRGDTVYSIARRFGVGHDDIQRDDGRQPTRLRPGQKVIIQGL